MVATKLTTAEDLSTLSSDDVFYELIDGELVELTPISTGHLVVVNRLLEILAAYSNRHPGTRAWAGEGGFVFGRNPDTVLAPDIIVLTEQQISALSPDAEGFTDLTPTIAIEVKSPSDREAQIARRLSKYLAAGVLEVWWVRTKERQITVHRPDEAPFSISHGEVLFGSELLPGFQFSVEQLFRK